MNKYQQIMKLVEELNLAELAALRSVLYARQSDLESRAKALFNQATMENLKDELNEKS